MHCRERDLIQLLAQGEPAANTKSIEAHLEKCPQCQSRLAELAGESGLGSDGFEFLRSAGEDKLNCDPHPSGILIEFSSLLASDVAVDSEPVDVGFLAPPVHPELLGRLGRYDIERVIGQGGMGIVLKAHDSELNRVVAVKVLSPHLANSAAARRRFAREAQAAAAVLHPNVLPVYDVLSEGKLPYLVMGYVAGQSLQARVDRDGPLEVGVALRIAKQTAAALAAAHAQGLVHRDVKPGNILLEEGVDRAQLSDFGLARTADDASLTRTGIVAGTPHYMSPEQACGEAIDARSDLFSLGCVLYFMLTARPPFRAESAMGVLNRICHHEHRPVHTINSSVPRQLSQLIDRLLAKRVSKRFDSAQSVEKSLDQMLVATAAGRLRFGTPRIRTAWSRQGLLVISSFVLLIVSGLVVSQSLWEKQRKVDSIQMSQWRQIATQSPIPMTNPRATMLDQFRGTAQTKSLNRNTTNNRHRNARIANQPSNLSSEASPATPHTTSPFLPSANLANSPSASKLQPAEFDPQKILDMDDKWKRESRELMGHLKQLEADSSIVQQSWVPMMNERALEWSRELESLSAQVNANNRTEFNPGSVFDVR